MKKLFLLVVFVVLGLFGFSQTTSVIKVTKTIVPLTSDIPVILQENIKGGFHQVTDASAKNSINSNLKSIGMVVCQQDNHTYYQWDGSSWRQIQFIRKWEVGTSCYAGDIFLYTNTLVIAKSDGTIGASDNPLTDSIKWTSLSGVSALSLSEVLGKGNNAGNSVITGLAAPVVSSDAATKGYVDLGLSGVEKQSSKNTSNGYVGLGSDGKIDQIYLPALTLNSAHVAASQAAQLALTVVKGDIAIRSDVNKTYINTTGANTSMSDWVELTTASSGVSSVNGSTGSVLLDLSSVLTQGANASGKIIASLGTPVNPADAATKAYVDTKVATVVDTDDQTLSEVLVKGNNAGNSVIAGLATPVSSSDAATKGYVDLGLSGVEKQSNKNTSNGYVGLGSDGKIDQIYLPALTLNSTHVAASQAAQLALTVVKGDIAIRSDENKTYINTTGSNASMSDWTLLTTASNGVSSVNGSTGSVLLDLSSVLTQGANASGKIITSVGTPVNPADAATKAYVDTKVGAVVDTDDQTLTLTGNTLSIERGNSIDLSSFAGGGGSQTLSLTGNILSIGGGNSIDLSSFKDNTDEQTLSNVLGKGNNAGNSVIAGLATPVSSSDAATKGYVDLGLSGVEKQSNKNTSNGYVGLGSDGKIDQIYLPALTLNSTHVAASQAAQLALTVVKGDIAIRSDVNKTYINTTGANTSMSDWVELTTASSGVSSVNGSTGSVLLDLSSVLTQGANASGKIIASLGTPVNPADAATKAYVDGSVTDNQKLTLSGNILSIERGGSDIDLSVFKDNTDDQTLSNVLGKGNNAGNSVIAGLATPVSSSDAATKGYVDLGLSGVEKQSNKNTSNGYVGLGSDGKIDQIYLPALTLNSTHVAASQAAQLALTVVKGDIAIRSDENKTYINTTGANASMSDWVELTTASNGVSSVNGSTGSVLLDLSSVLTQGANASGKIITSVGTPVNPADAATKAYVDTKVGAVVDTDDQTLTLTGNTLSIVRGNSIDLSSFAGGGGSQTLSLTGNILSIGGGNSIDLSGFKDNTDEQTLTNVLGKGNNAGNSVITGLAAPVASSDAATKAYVDDRVAAVVDTDDQTLSEVLVKGNNAGNQIISGLKAPLLADDAATKSYVDGRVAAVVDTDNQKLTLSGNTISIERGGSGIDLSAFKDNTDSQTLTLVGNTLSIAGGNNVDLSAFKDNTDNQVLTLSGNTLTLERGGTSIDLSAINTDNQNLTNVLGRGNSAGGTVITGLGTPTLGSDAATKAYVDGSVHDNQALTLSGNILTLERGGSSIDLSVINTDSQNLTNVLGKGNNAGNSVITGLATPVSSSDAATKGYVDSGLVGVEKQSNKNTANGYVGLNADSKVDVAYLPSMLLNATYTIANQSAQLALLNINRGDIAIRTDENKTYLNITGNNTAMSDWLELLSPTNGVTSINGSTGAVILDLASVLTKGSNAAGKTITSLGTPVNSTDATNKAYVDGVVHDNQTLTLSGNTLTLERGGSSIDLSAFKDNTDGQTLSLAGNVLSITGGNNVNLSTINTDSQNLSDVLDRGNDAGGRVITGLGTPTSNNDAATKFYVDDKVSKVVTPDDQTAAEVPSTATGGISSTNVQAAITELDTEKLGTTTSFSGDVAGAYNNIRLNVGVVNSSIIADGSITTTDFSSMGATNGQVLKYNGTNWVPSEGMTNGTSQYNTLYWNGTSWVESSALKNNNTDLTASGDLVLNGGDLTTTATTASIFNSGATTLNIGSSATTTTIGSSAGTAVTTVNSNLKVGTVTADKITMNGGDFMVAGDAEIKGILWAYDVATASDQRLKANITTLTGVLEKINQLRGVSYVFKDQKKYATGPQVGLIAQELQKVYPELVSKGADGYLGVNYSQLTAVLVQAIKEQQKQISIQSELLAKQQQQINEIQKTLNALSSKSGGR